MSPTEFVAGLADIMGVPRTEIATVDRALAKQGLRQRARGRYRPDISLAEGVQIVCAWAGSENLTLAAAEVERLNKFAAVPEGLEPEAEDFQNYFGCEPEDLSGKKFLRVVEAVGRQLRTQEELAERIWVNVEKRGFVDITYRPGIITRKLPFSVAVEKGFMRSKRNVTVRVSIRGPVLSWIHQVTENR